MLFHQTLLQLVCSCLLTVGAHADQFHGQFDVLVYGSTPSGVVAAVAAARHGATTALRRTASFPPSSTTMYPRTHQTGSIPKRSSASAAEGMLAPVYGGIPLDDRSTSPTLASKTPPPPPNKKHHER
jgi:hypothetical protein